MLKLKSRTHLQKIFRAVGFGGFLNFSIPVSEANYVTFEGGFEYFKDKNTNTLGLIPVLVGYRYTLDHSGSGFCIEPNAGYTFNASDFVDVNGASAGISAGYLIDLGNVPFNFSLRYEHFFGNPATNMFSFRIAHSFGS
jgi:hypothetical protein